MLGTEMQQEISLKKETYFFIFPQIFQGFIYFIKDFFEGIRYVYIMNKHDLMYVVRFFLSTYWKAAIMKNTRKVLQVMMEEC